MDKRAWLSSTIYFDDSSEATADFRKIADITPSAKPNISDNVIVMPNLGETFLGTSGRWITNTFAPFFTSKMYLSNDRRVDMTESCEEEESPKRDCTRFSSCSALKTYCLLNLLFICVA